jgi:hypothetical protein
VAAWRGWDITWPAAAGRLQQMYDAGLRSHGHDVASHYIAQLRAVYVAETRERAWDDAEASVLHDDGVRSPF